jgi:hypothetical protein
MIQVPYRPDTNELPKVRCVLSANWMRGHGSERTNLTNVGPHRIRGSGRYSRGMTHTPHTQGWWHDEINNNMTLIFCHHWFIASSSALISQCLRTLFAKLQFTISYFFIISKQSLSQLPCIHTVYKLPYLPVWRRTDTMLFLQSHFICNLY